MASILYDKDGKQHKVKSIFVTHMLDRGYTSTPPSSKPASKAELKEEIQNELALDVEEAKTTKRTLKAKA